MGFNTSLVHTDKPGSDNYGATMPPIYQVSAFAYDSAEQLEKIFNNRAPGFSYTRAGNPTVEAFEKRITAIEGGISAVACSSGMAAITAALLTVVGAGDEIIAGTSLFGGTLDLFDDLKALGITVHFLEEVTPDTVKEAITDRTRVVFTEIIGNPKLNVVDLAGVSAVCKEYGIPLIVDSTTATPCLINPLKEGANIVIHSSSKYINGGGNSISGVIVDGGTFRWKKEKYPQFSDFAGFGSFAFTARIRNRLLRNTGCCLSPFNAYMNLVGIETLGLRMERCCANAGALAEYLSGLEGIEVNYPGLPSSPYYGLVQKQFNGRGGAIVTLRAGSKERAFKLINSLKYAAIATNIGDVRTLVIHPASTIYTHSTEQQQINAGVYNDTIRISVGIEDADDLIADFGQAVRTLEDEH